MKGKTVKVCCLGTFVGNNNKKISGFQLVDENLELIGRTSHFSHMTHPWAGAIFDVQGSIENNQLVSIDKNYFKFDQELPDEEKRIRIKAASDAAVAEIDAVNQAKKTKKQGKEELLRLLAPLRKEYQKTSATGKIALEVRVLNYLRNGRDL